MNDNKLSKEYIEELVKTKKDSNRVIKRENTMLEFKENFSYNSLPFYFKTMSAFANRNGGYIIFGIKDKPRELIGLSEKSFERFDNLKIEEVTERLNDFFLPEINWECCTYEIKKKQFGIIYTHELENKPAICKKNDDKNDLKDGEIYYRYSGRTQKIKYAELVEIIDNKRKKEEKMWLDYLIKSAKVGIENIGLLNMKTGNLQGKNIESMYIDEELLKKIKFIQEGKFVEKEGKPTLRIIGDINNVNGEKIILKSGKEKISMKCITENDIIEAFLMNKKIEEDAEQYIGQMPFCSTGFMPIYYFIDSLNMEIEEVREILENVNVKKSAKNKLIDRLIEKRREKENMPKENENIIKAIEEIEKDEEIENNYNIYLRTLLCVEESLILSHINKIKENLLKIFYEKYSSDDRALVGKLRKTICRVDEIVYDFKSKKINEKNM